MGLLHLTEAIRMLNDIQNAAFRRLILRSNENADWLLSWLLREYGIKPVIVGGLAVQRHGYRRFTEDVDILISRSDYERLENDGKIKFGMLKVKPGIQIDVLWEGRDGNPHPDFVRDGNSYYPTLEGLIYLKLLARRIKDRADVVELLKTNGLSHKLYKQVRSFLPAEMHTLFQELWEAAKSETET